MTDGEVGGCQIWLETHLPDGDDFMVQRSCVLSSQQLATWIDENLGGLAEGANIRLAPFGGVEPGWVDLDGDGDFDLWLTLYNLQTGNLIPIWLKNTGFEKEQFAAGDINQDGYVDGVDIAQLLSDWTGG